jgi:hypothetical protein
VTKTPLSATAILAAALVCAACSSSHPATASSPATTAAAPVRTTSAPPASPTPTTAAGTVNADLTALAARATSYGKNPTYAQIEAFVGYESTNLADTGNRLPQAVQSGTIGTALTNYQDAIAQLYDDMTSGSATQTVLQQDKRATDSALGTLAKDAGTPQTVVSALS